MAESPQFLLTQEVVRTLSEESYCSGLWLEVLSVVQHVSKFVYYENHFFFVYFRLLLRSMSVVLAVQMNSKSSNINVFYAIPLYHVLCDNRAASLFKVTKMFLGVADDNSHDSELDCSALHQCSSDYSLIRFCHRGFSTPIGNTLLCLSSLIFDYANPALWNCVAIPVSLNDTRRDFRLAERLYHVISRNTFSH